jgi:hypothetical protein
LLLPLLQHHYLDISDCSFLLIQLLFPRYCTQSLFRYSWNSLFDSSRVGTIAYGCHCQSLVNRKGPTSDNLQKNQLTNQHYYH